MEPDPPRLLFLRAFYYELLGRYAHLQQFVDRTRRDAGTHPAYFLADYSARTTAAFKNLLGLGSIILRVPKSAAKTDQLEYPFDYLREEATRFQEFHRALRWFPSPWPNSDITQFLWRLFQEKGIKGEMQWFRPSIVYSDRFNFFEWDISDHLRKSVGSPPLAAWAIPKSESTNPLLWPVLIHEVAHTLFSDKEVLEAVSPVLARHHNVSMQNLPVLQRWSIELNADLFGYRLLGPAYLCSTQYFSMFFITNNLRQPILTGNRNVSRYEFAPGDRNLPAPHPPPQTRVDLMLEEFSNFRPTEAQERGRAKSIIDNFKELFSARLEFDKVLLNFDEQTYAPYLPTQETAREIWAALKTFQAGRLPEKSVWKDDDMRNSWRLLRRLDADMLGSSIPRTGVDEKIRDYVAAYRTNAAEKPDRWKALSALNERPATMFEILNAGWLHKTIFLWSGLSKDADLPSVNSDDAADVDSLLEFLREPARQLQDSVQVALILSSLPLLQVGV